VQITSEQDSCEIESPCTGICRLDAQQRCEGCLRSIEEIIAWPTADRETRRQILRAVAARRLGRCG
jgi:uncharacterized protein